MPETLSIVFPALNEAEGILEAIDDAEATLNQLVARDILQDYEILVVDDGSTDGTGELVARRAEQDRFVRPVSHAVNRGVGAALRTAIGVSNGTLLLYTDADMPVDLAVLASAIPLLADTGAGMVVGRRRSYGDEGVLRVIVSKAYDWVAHVLLGVREEDVNFPFKLVARDTALRLELRSDGALVDVELLARVHQLGLGVEQIALDYRPRLHDESKTLTIRLLTRLGAELLRHGASIRGHRRGR